MPKTLANTGDGRWCPKSQNLCKERETKTMQAHSACRTISSCRSNVRGDSDNGMLVGQLHDQALLPMLISTNVGYDQCLGHHHGLYLLLPRKLQAVTGTSRRPSRSA